MKILVTGGAGFIGSAVCRHIISALGWQLVVVDKLTYAGHLSSLVEISTAAGYRFIKADICDRETINAILLEQTPDAVMHLAAESHVDRSITASDSFITTNVVGTFTLLEAVRNYLDRLSGATRDRFRFLHISTDEVYGSLGNIGRFTEMTPYSPRSPYAASKAASDHLAKAWHHTYGLPIIVCNCSNNYGPYQLPEKLIPLMILNALEDRPLPIYGKGHNVRDWLFVQDHVEALMLILTKGEPGETYNIGGNNERTNLSVVEKICDLVDVHIQRRVSCRSLITFVDDRPGHDFRYSIDPLKIEMTLGWRARYDFQTGLEKTVMWYISNESWWRPLRELGLGKARLGLPVGIADP